MPVGKVALFLIAGVLSFSFSPILVRLASDAPPAAVAALRTLFAVAFLAPFAIGQSVAEMRRMNAREIGLVALAGVLLGTHFIVWIESIYHTSVASAAVLFTTNPIFIAVLGFWFLSERLDRGTTIAIVVGVVGAIMIAAGETNNVEHPNAFFGNGLALSSAVLFACYLLIGRVVRRHSSWLGYVFPLYVFVAVTVVGYLVVRGFSLSGYSAEIYILCALMALGPQVLGHGSFNYAVKYIPAAYLGAIGLAEPVIAAIMAWYLFEEVPGPVAAVGAMVVLAALTWMYLHRASIEKSRRITSSVE